MNRQPTLAEILSDDTGLIRPEVADLLLTPRPRVLAQRRVVRQAPAVQPAPPRLPLGRVWIGIGIIIVLAGIVISVIANIISRRVNAQENLANSFEPVAFEISAAPPVTVPAAAPAVSASCSGTSQAVEYNVVTPVKAPEIERDSDQSGQPMLFPAGKIARVLGDGVSIRTQPNLQSYILSKVKQNEIVNVISLDKGWYQVKLANQHSGYIFGAFLYPQDFDSSPYRVAIAKADQTKMLVKDTGQTSYFQTIWPNGQIMWILKDDVAIYK